MRREDVYKKGGCVYMKRKGMRSGVCMRRRGVCLRHVVQERAVD